MAQLPEVPSADWIAASAQIIQQLGRDDFPEVFRALLQTCCRFESMILSRFSGTSAPICLYQDLDEMQAAISVEFYASGPYLLDPLYQACRNNAEPGAYRLLDLAPETFFRSEYYKTFYRKISISDEIGILIKEAEDRWIVISLARFTRQPKFKPEDAQRLNAVFTLISSAALRHWGEAVTSQEKENTADWQQRMQTFGNGRLSPREMEVVLLVLQGHSSPTAAAYLGITVGTVKVHRHHAYAKLGVASQAELFAMATRHLSSSQ